MKITEVRSIQPKSINSPKDWRTSMGQILVAIDTDTGLTGYGVGGGGLAGIHVVRSILRDFVIGQDVNELETLWNKMYAATLPFGRKGLAIMALSGVDLALWDLKGKAEKKPIATLLGGDINQKIPTYLTAWNEIKPEEMNNARAFKLHVGLTESESLVEHVTGTVGKARKQIGAGTPLMIDAWMKWSLAETLAIAENIKQYQLDWIEEPLPPDDICGYVELHDRSPIAIAGGEHEFTAYGFADVIESRLYTILQPDVCWCGGLTELIKIYKMASEAGLQVCPHRGAELWGLHAVAALDPNPLAESGRPWMDWVGGQPEIIDGFIALTDRPGFGAIIDEQKLQAME